MYTKCPNCGSDINYAFEHSYYLRCKRSYECWHEHCDESTAKLYPEYINQNEEFLAYRMREKVQDDDCDYFYDE